MQKQISKMSFILSFLLTIMNTGCELNSEEKNSCSEPSDCLDGFSCNVGTCELAEPDAGTCEPLTCETTQCDSVDDGCGGTIDCGGCMAPAVCAGNGTANQCGVPPDHCTNSILDVSEGETDTDCGGSCTGCEYGDSCDSANDCRTGSCSDEVCREGTWSSVASMPTSRGSFAAVYGPDDRIYAIGGFANNGGGQLGTLEAYNPITDSWTTLAPMPTPRQGLSAVVGTDGRIYTIGGDYDNVSSPSLDGNSVVVEAYDPNTNTWESMAELRNGRYLGAAVTGNNGIIYAMGGFSVNPIEVLSTVESYNEETDSWTTLSGQMTSKRKEFATVVGLDGRIYAIGGDDGSNRLSTVEYLEPGIPGWNTLPDMPTWRDNLAAVTGVDGRIFAIGGLGPATYLDVVEVFTPTSRTWTGITPMPTGRNRHAAVVAPDGKIYVLGGHTSGSNSAVGTVEVLILDN